MISEPSHCETCNYYGGHAEWCEWYKELERELQLAESRLKKVTAELEQAREALRMVEWINGECPWCGNLSPNKYYDSKVENVGHRRDCPRQKALGNPKLGLS